MFSRHFRRFQRRPEAEETSRRTSLREVQSLWKDGRRLEAASLAEQLFVQGSRDLRVALFYPEFLFYCLGQQQMAIDALLSRFAVLPSPRLFISLARMHLSAGRYRELMDIAKTCFQHPKCAGSAFLGYGSALLGMTADLELAAGFLNRASFLGRLGRHTDPASLVVSPKAFRGLNELPGTQPAQPLAFIREAYTAANCVACTSGDESCFRAFLKRHRAHFGASDRGARQCVHFHIVGADEASAAELAEIGEDGPLPWLNVSFETVQGARQVSPNYWCFLHAPRLLEHYDCPIAIVDPRFLSDLDIEACFGHCANVDFGVRESAADGFLWEKYSAEVAVFSPTDAGVGFARALRAFLMHVPTGCRSKQIIQLGLAECVYLHRSLKLGSVASLCKDLGTVLQ